MQNTEGEGTSTYLAQFHKYLVFSIICCAIYQLKMTRSSTGESSPQKINGLSSYHQLD